MHITGANAPLADVYLVILLYTTDQLVEHWRSGYLSAGGVLMEIAGSDAQSTTAIFSSQQCLKAVGPGINFLVRSTN